MPLLFLEFIPQGYPMPLRAAVGSRAGTPVMMGKPKDGIFTPVAEAPWSGAEWAVALRFDNPRATVLVLLLG